MFGLGPGGQFTWIEWQTRLGVTAGPLKVTGLGQIADAAVDFTWSPGGQFLAFTHEDEERLWRWTVRVHNIRTGHEVEVIGPAHLSWSPVFSEDGKTLYFVGRRIDGGDRIYAAHDPTGQWANPAAIKYAAVAGGYQPTVLR